MQATGVFELIKAGGWVMLPLILCSVAALAIIGERLWSLQRKYVCPPNLIPQVRQWLERNELDAPRIALVSASSPMGRVVAAGLLNRQHSREVIKEALEDAGRHATPELERYLRTLGTIGNIAPFLGLLGTSMQWLFNRSRLLGQRNGGGQCLSAVISAGHDVVQWDNARITAAVTIASQ